MFLLHGRVWQLLSPIADLIHVYYVRCDIHCALSVRETLLSQITQGFAFLGTYFLENTNK